MNVQRTVVLVLAALIGTSAAVYSYDSSVQSSIPGYDATTATILTLHTAPTPDDKYKVVFLYSYSVDGHTYVGEDFYPEQFSRKKALPSKQLEQYAEGNTVTVHYPPGKPGDAFIFDDR